MPDYPALYVDSPPTSAAGRWCEELPHAADAAPLGTTTSVMDTPR
jgi:hypothetical protein